MKEVQYIQYITTILVANLQYGYVHVENVCWHFQGTAVWSLGPWPENGYGTGIKQRVSL